MTQPDKLPLTSLPITEHQQEKVKSLFPEVFTEGGKIDFEKLKLTLGEAVDTGKERYGMTWPGKADCFKTIQQPSIATLVPDREGSVNFDATENLFIEGDNLEVLKLLQKSYLGKVKMIYIDPPYNTGNEFIYPDNYAESLDTYLDYTGQVDGEGRKFSTNTETDGRFHSKWMNMMYPRLFLAKNLLKDDGVIFISIDDGEVNNLRALCNEIFGEENFVANIIWQKKYSVSNDDPGVAPMHDFIVCFQKSTSFQRNLLPRTEKQILRYKNPENDERGVWASAEYVSSKSKEERPTLWYAIKHPKTGEAVWPDERAVWRYSKEKHEQNVLENRLYWGPNQSYEKPRLKRFLSEIQEGLVPTTWWTFDEVGHNDEGQKETAELIGKKVFSTPKPIRLLKRMIEISCGKNDIILDFFAGSATTAHAVLELNKQDGGHRKFICVQLPEPTDEKSEAAKAGYKNIAEISKERIRRVIKKLTSDGNEKPPQEKNKQQQTLGLDVGTASIGSAIIDTPPQDLGFKAFKLAPSNFKLWNAAVEKTPEAVQAQLYNHIDHISPAAESEAILYELLLKSGFPLTTPIQTIMLPTTPLSSSAGEGPGVRCYSIASGAMLICLEKELTASLIKAMAEMGPQRVICLDEGFGDNDQLKTNAVQIMKSKKVEKFQTV